MSVHLSRYLSIYILIRSTPEHFDFKRGLRKSSSTKLSLAALNNQATRSSSHDGHGKTNQNHSHGSNGGIQYRHQPSSEER